MVPVSSSHEEEVSMRVRDSSYSAHITLPQLSRSNALILGFLVVVTTYVLSDRFGGDKQMYYLPAMGPP
jgi:hypothetical protein